MSIRFLVAVLVVAALVAPAGATPEGPSLRALSERALVSTPGHRLSEFASATDPSDPQHIVATAMDWDGPGARIACGIYSSDDGGRSWSGADNLAFREGTTDNWDAWVAIDRDGVTHATCMGSGVGALYSRSVDRGASWSSSIRLPTSDPANSVDKEAILAARDGTLFACFIEYGGVGLAVTRSFDGGVTWENAHAAAPGLSSGCNGIAEGPDGEVYLSWRSSDGAQAPFDGVGVIASKDRGVTWSPISTAFVQKHCGAQAVACAVGFDVRPTPTFVSFAADPVRGALFLAGSTLEERGPQTPSPKGPVDRYVLALSRSLDDGASWTRLDAPMPAAPGCVGCHVVSPTLASDPQGRIALEYTLMEEASPAQPKEVWLTVSLDDGASWLAPILVASVATPQSWVAPQHWINEPSALVGLATAPIDAQTPDRGLGAAVQNYNSFGQKDGGHYFSLTYSDEGFVALWLDHANGLPQLWSRVFAIE